MSTTCVVVIIGLELCDVSLEGGNILLGNTVLGTNLQGIAGQDQLLYSPFSSIQLFNS